MSDPSTEHDQPHDGPDDAAGDDTNLVEGDRRGVVVRVIIRIAVMAVGIGIAAFVLASAFDDLDLDAILDAVRSLDDAQRLSLIGSTGIVIWSEALLTSSVVPGLPARRGAMAWLGPTAVASIVPGPSDMPMRYKMFVSWGLPAATATTGVAASALINIALKLVLPAIAGVTLVVADIPLDGVAETIVSVTAILAILITISVVVLGSASRTAAAGRTLDRIWRPTLRLLRREVSGPPLADRLVDGRAEAIRVMHGRWVRSGASAVFVCVTRVSLFVMCLRFAGVPESAVSWQAVFCVWAIVRGLTVIPLMPGNAGVSELAFIGMLAPIAGTQYVNQVTAGVLLFRVLTWLLMIPAGGVAIGLWRRGLQSRDPPTHRPAETAA